jgi:hypothetical protein
MDDAVFETLCDSTSLQILVLPPAIMGTAKNNMTNATTAPRMDIPKLLFIDGSSAVVTIIRNA